MHETLRVYYRVISLRKKRSEIYYGAKGLLRPKTGLVLPKFHSKKFEFPHFLVLYCAKTAIP